MIRFQKRNFDIFATTEQQDRQDEERLWFAFKKGTLIYLQQRFVWRRQRRACCDSLSKKELWYICNNGCVRKSGDVCVVIRFQKRNFDIFATTEFANKKLELSCDSLSKKELWYICNNGRRWRVFSVGVVIRFQKRNFDIFATTRNKNKMKKSPLWFAFKKGTLIYLQQLIHFSIQLMRCCDSLSKKELWYICNN